MFKTVHGKLGNMRKSVDWVVYPKTSGLGDIFVQSDRYACRFDPETGEGYLSNGKGHPAFFTTTRQFGAKPVTVPQDFIDACLEAQPQKGDRIHGVLVIG